MSLPLRHLVLATATTLAVGAGVGAAPALASPDLLALSIRNVQPVIAVHLGTAHNAAQERADARRLDENASACAEAVKLIAPLPATAAQGQAKRRWLAGVRLAIVADRQYATGLREDAAGRRTAGASAIGAASPKFALSDRDIAEADHVFGVR